VENISAEPDNDFLASVTVMSEVQVSAISCPSCFKNTEHLSVATDTIANTLTDTSTNGCFAKPANAESNFARREINRSTTVDTLTGKVIDKSGATKHDLSALSKSLTLSASSSLPAVVTATSSSAAINLPEIRSTSSQPVAGPTNLAVTSSFGRQDVSAPLAVSTAESMSSILIKYDSVDTVRPVTVRDNDLSGTSIQASANARSINQPNRVERNPIHLTLMTGNITVSSGQYVTRCSTGLPYPNTTPNRAAASASKPYASNDTSKHSAASAVESSSATPDVVRSAVPNREVTVKCTDYAASFSLQSCASNDTNVSTVSSPLRPSLSSSSLSSSLPSSFSSDHDSSFDYSFDSSCEIVSVDAKPPYTASTSSAASDERFRFPLSDEYDFRLVCNTCFKPKTAEMMPQREHGCRQDMLAVNKIGTDQWCRIRQRNTSVMFEGDYVMCRDGKNCYKRLSGCSYAHCDAERRLWNLEKKSTLSVAEFISEHKISAFVCDVKSLLDKYPVSTIQYYIINDLL